MKTPKFQLTVRAVAAAALALAGSFHALPALAEIGVPEPVSTASTASPAADSSFAARVEPTTGGAVPATVPAAVPNISAAGLAEALRRDLGMTLEEFNAAGQLGRTAADALPSVQELPGYQGIRLQDGQILVEGSGAGLQARVDELNGSGSAAVFVLVAPAVEAPTTAAVAAPTTPGADASTAPADEPSAGPSTAATAASSAEPTAASSAAPSAASSAASSAVPTPAELLASSTDQLFQAYVREVGPAGLQAVAYSGGNFVIRTGGTNAAEAGPTQVPDQQAALDQRTAPDQQAAPDQQSATEPGPAATATAPGKISPADFVARYANVQLEQGSPVTTEADVFGGEGIAIDRRTICSTGFGAFSAAGLPVVLTAGHCAEDGAALIAELEPPTSATAGGSAPGSGMLAPLGSFGFSQFGGPLNSWITGTEDIPGNVGTDIAVIEDLDGRINLQPAATTWADAANPGATAVKIIGMVAPFEGQEVCRSGRTAGWSCGQVEETGVYVVGGRTTATADLRAFRGFLSRNVQSRGGDSGGPWISGNFAVGTHSAGETSGENFAIATTLEDALTKFPTPVQLQLFLNKPELAAPEDLKVLAGQPITGRVLAGPASAVAANSQVRVTFDEPADQETLEVPVDAAGNWSFPAPESNGRMKFTAETVNGFSRSGEVSLAVEVTDLDAPEIATPAEGAALESVTRIDGTGTPGLTVKLTGDISGSAVVGADGQWTVPVEDAEPGRFTISAVQTSPGKADSPSVSRTFTIEAPVVVPVEPVVPAEPLVPAEPAVPVEPFVPTEPVVPVEPVVPAGIVVPPAALAAPADPAEAVTPVLPAASGQLPNTGAGSLLPTAGLAGGAILLGGVLLAATRRRTVR
ncbi:hypothetical protein J2W14_001755 [Pseudarthrobacter oxydans]|uniref:S1 family peptidase n=1 Tax=Pseudarthrobacter oxydans TaxID=1671 RepID=UPI002789332D|nr:S1 family peptidase [Pseudarthrobacter oxydans]MDP9982367.1 hypothetical protein [Pseudarthrobacter oxydans]